MANIDQVNAIIRRHGYEGYRWLDPKQIVVSEWVRMKCEFGCPSYGRVASCPPNTPTVDACRRFFAEYDHGIVFHFQKTAPDRDTRNAWSGQTNIALTEVERDVFLAGYPKTFLLFMDSCHICDECTASRTQCKEPKLSRPSPEGMAIDVFATVCQLGYPIDVLTDPGEQMNRFAFLLVD